jgi:hypothetical protein
VPWTCPDCGALIRYEDYGGALKGEPFACHCCGREIVVDKKTDTIILVPGSTPIQKRA